MILEIDAGNTALKWRLLTEHGRIIDAGRYLHDEAFNLAEAITDKPVRVINLACVANREIEDNLVRQLERVTGIKPVFAKTRKQYAGLTIAYDDPSRLGVDRWLAMLAACQRSEGACCVIDCGSAITADWIDENGIHKGGYIVPGIANMQRGLLRNTGQIKIQRAENNNRVDWGRNTEQAVNYGILRMAKDFIQSVITEVLGVDRQCVCFMTGGDAQLLLPREPSLFERIRVEPDLVLDGLAIALRGS